MNVITEPQAPTPEPAALDEQLQARDPARIAGMFDAIARRYDLLNRVLSAGLDRRWRRRAVRALGLADGERLLDLCTGTADVALEAARQAPRGGPIVGVDFSHEMLRLGRDKVAASTLDARVTLVRGDAMRLPLATGAVDAAIISFGIRNVQTPDAACRELARVLRPGGRLAVLEFGLPPPGLMRSAYLWYARRVLPAVGRAVSRHASAYAYLPESVSRFPPPDVFGQTLQRSGFPHVEIEPLTFGIVYLYLARRQGPGG